MNRLMMNLSTAARRDVTASLTHAARAAVEPLEGRQMLSASLSNGVLTVDGTDNADSITLDYNELLPQYNVGLIRVRQNGNTVFDWTANSAILSIVVNGKGGVDTIDCHALKQAVTVNGGAGNDTIKGGAAGDTLHGGDNDDTIFGNAGDDTLDGGANNDTLNGGLGADKFIGGTGEDMVSYADRTASVNILLNPLPVSGQQFEGDKINTDVENAEGGAGADIICGNNFANKLFGNGKADIIYGGAGDDELHGGSGDDTLYGEEGFDTLHGDGGNDTLVTVGGGDQDLLYGEGGYDTFWFDAHYGIEEAVDPSPTEISTNHLHRIDQFHDYGISLMPWVANSPTLQIPVGKEPNGEDLYDPIPLGGQAFKDFSSQPLFPSTGPSSDDVIQGQVGDCWFGESISTIARKNPDRIRQSVVALGDGTYAVRFYIGGYETFYRVDGDLPVDGGGNLVYLKKGAEGCIYTAILEKAYAFARSGQGTYASLDFGPLHEGFDIFGCTQVGNKLFGKFATANAFLTNVDSLLSQGFIASYASFFKVYDDAAIVPEHAYSIVSVNHDLAGHPVSLTMRNPWGKDGVNKDNNPSDGYVTLTAHQAWMCLWELTWAMA